MGHSQTMLKSIFSLFYLLGLLSGNALFAQGNYNLTEESNLFTPVADVDLATDGNKSFKLSEIYQGSPVILTFVFTRCAGICSPLLLHIKENVRILNPKENFKIVVVSIDPEDTPEDMAKYSTLYSLHEDKRWIFATTPQIEELNTSVGFAPILDSLSGQYEHEALLVGLNEEGYIVRKQIGIRSTDELHSLLKEINNEFILSYPLPRENMLFSCFTYDPATGKKSPSIGLLILLLPAVLTLILLLIITTIKRKKRAHHAQR